MNRSLAAPLALVASALVSLGAFHAPAPDHLKPYKPARTLEVPRGTTFFRK